MTSSVLRAKGAYGHFSRLQRSTQAKSRLRGDLAISTHELEDTTKSGGARIYRDAGTSQPPSTDAHDNSTVRSAERYHNVLH